MLIEVVKNRVSTQKRNENVYLIRCHIVTDCATILNHTYS